MTSYARWSPADYLKQYYATSGVAEDEKGILRFVLNFLRENRREKFSEMLEVGCGPTIHHIVPFVPYVDHLYVADFLKGNLEEVMRWAVNAPNAHNWTPYLSGTLVLEGKKTKAAVQERIRLLQEHMAGFLTCNVLETNPLGHLRQRFPLVTSFYCLECLGTNKNEWKRAMKNVSSLVAPRGWLVLSSLNEADKYMVCGKEFPTTHVTETDLRESLIASGFIRKTINIQVCPCEWADEGFSSILICSAQKK